LHSLCWLAGEGLQGRSKLCASRLLEPSLLPRS
jgi:hypothetical protein